MQEPQNVETAVAPPAELPPPVAIRVVCDRCSGDVVTNPRDGRQSHVDDPEDGHQPAPRAAGQ